MADDNERSNDTAMNLDLNLRLGSDDPVNSDVWADESADRIREAVRRTSRQRWRWINLENRQMENQNVGMDLSWFLSSVGDGDQSGLHMGEGSVAAEERVAEVEKICENKVIVVDDETLGEKDEDDKGSGDDGSFYDCNICFELAKDPVITCCGHLYCWPCIYRWLHIHSDKETNDAVYLF